MNKGSGRGHGDEEGQRDKGGGQVMESLESKEKGLELDAVCNGEPGKVSEDRGDMFTGTDGPPSSGSSEVY